MPRPGDPFTGGPRPRVETRVNSPISAWVHRRGQAETDGNVSEILALLISYALPRMPVGYDPDADPFHSTTTEETP